MQTMTLTTLIASLAILTLLFSRHITRAGARRCEAPVIAASQPARTEPFPRLTRNRWARRDLARMLMTDDAYTGRISPPSGQRTERE